VSQKQLIPEGYYKGTIENIRLSSSGQKGTPKFEITIVLEGNVKRRVDLWLTPKSEQYSLDKMRRVGATDLSNPGNITHAADEFEWACKHEPGTDGNLYEKWDLAPPPKPKQESKPVDPDYVRQLRARLGSVQPPKPATTPPKPPPRQPPKTAAKPGISTEQEAWDELARLFPNKSEDAMGREWARAIEQVEGEVGAIVANWKGPEWQKVVDAFLPF